MIDRCILCRVLGKPLTDEHIFPYAAGGRISRDLLCKDCNDKLGRFVDAWYLSQFHIETARALHNLPGRPKQPEKEGRVPSPLAGRYEIEHGGELLQLKVGEDMSLTHLPQSPEIKIDGEQLVLSIGLDAKDERLLPGIARKKLERFFASEEGRRWVGDPERQEQIISKFIADIPQHVQRREIENPVLHASKVIDYCAVFAEHTKVLYEIACLEFKDQFIASEQAQHIRRFLKARLSNEDKGFDLEEQVKQLSISHFMPPGLDALLQKISQTKLPETHIALVMPTMVCCSLFGFGSMMKLNVPCGGFEPKVYINELPPQGRVEIITLAQRIVELGPKYFL